MAERFKRPSIVTPEEIERARVREQTGDMVPNVMRQSTEGTTGAGFIDSRMGEGFVQRVKNRFFPSREESARRQAERTRTFLDREAQPQGFVPEGDYFQGLKGNPIARANQSGTFAPDTAPGRSAARMTAEQQSNAQALENSAPPPQAQPEAQPMRRFNFGGEQDIVNFNGTWTNVPKGTDPTAETMAAANASLDARFGAGRQGVYSANTGRTVMLDGDRAQRTRDWADSRGIPQMPDAPTSQQVNRFQRGGQEQESGPKIFWVGDSGGLYGNAAADVIATAQRIGQRRGLRRDAAIAREQEQQIFERGISEGNLRANLGNARAQLLNAQRVTPGKNDGIIKFNPPKASFPGMPIPERGTIQFGDTEVDATQEQMDSIKKTASVLLSLNPDLTEQQALFQSYARFIRGLENQQE